MNAPNDLSIFLANPNLNKTMETTKTAEPPKKLHTILDYVDWDAIGYALIDQCQPEETAAPIAQSEPPLGARVQT